jgi:uncharacterized protein YjeT (DUF2065 family)
MHRREAGEGIISAISVGAVLILIGIAFVTTPDLWGKIVNFVNSINTTQVSNSGIYLLAPKNPAAHTGLYAAVAQFALGLGVLQILLLALRLTMHSRIRRIAQTVGDLVFWFGTYYLITTALNAPITLESWFVFWAEIIILIGVSLIVRAPILLAGRHKDAPKQNPM